MITLREVNTIQDEFVQEWRDMKSKKNKKGSWVDEAGRIVLPQVMVERFIITAHNTSGHGSVDEVLRILEHFFFVGVPKNKQKILAQTLKRWCLHCDKDVKMIRRPLGETYHPVEGEVVLYMVFLKIKDSHLLVILEDISRNILLAEDPSPCAAVVVKALVTWRGLIGLPAIFTLVSDNGSHFNNEVLRQFESRFPSEHKFSIVYSP
eukprot:snap_masked-scaffold_29-processed-gene-0.14-mRNA-1 protein AED:0.75 eAED:0.75 QI:0/-1/0/1/-1/1/1/0/206